MNIQETRELLDLLEKQNPNLNMRLVLDNLKLLNELKNAKYLVAIEANAWNPAELHVSKKLA